MAVRDVPIWEQPEVKEPHLAEQGENHRAERLTLDPRPRTQDIRELQSHMDLTSKRFWIATVILGGLVMAFMGTWLYQMIEGLGITGLNRPVMWSLYIVNFVYFIGVGHAGTFISAALRALKVEWRRPISRAAEFVTLFALSTAAIFPLVHLGRTWKAYWLLPYPNVRQLWPSYHSPLLWDLTAIITYLTCSILFAYIALIPDLATMRDHSTGWRHSFYRALAVGWRGSEREWHNHEVAQNVFTYAIIPVMFSVHTIVSWDFAMALQPGWHSTIFGPYFVVGALFSGAGAVIMALVILNKTLNLGYFLRAEHFDGMAKFLLLLSLTWGYFYFNDYLPFWYGGAPADKVLFKNLSTGFAAPFWYTMIACNVVVPWIALAFKKVRRSMGALFFISLLVQVGMYFERVIIVPVSLATNELPFNWGRYYLRTPETIITIGAFGLVGFLYVLATRIFPIIPAWEVHEGQLLQGVRKIGKALVPSRGEPE